MKKRPLVRVLTVVGVLAAVFLVVMVGFIVFMNNGMNETQALAIRPVTAAKLADGTYNGQYSGGRWANRLAVSVKGGRITNVQVEQSVLFEKPEVTSELIARVIKAQAPDVDIIGGSTVTCKAYLKSIEDALDGP